MQRNRNMCNMCNNATRSKIVNPHARLNIEMLSEFPADINFKCQIYFSISDWMAVRVELNCSQ